MTDEVKRKKSRDRSEKTLKHQKRTFSAGDDSRPDGSPTKPRKSQKSATDNAAITEQVSVKSKTFDLSEMDAAEMTPWMRDKGKKAGGRKNRKNLRDNDPYPGDAPIPDERIKKYTRGNQMDMEGIKSKFHSKQLKRREENYEKATRTAARTELLHTEQGGFIEADDGEYTTDLTQHEIARSVDITSATKFFELKLDKFGPYQMNYTRNGRFLLVGGGKGHVAAIDWQTKKLMCEMNVMETCHDAKWLHIETMFAVAQRQWTYIYDNQGIELHCLKSVDAALRLEFLPYHFLLAAGNTKGYLQWLDVSVGQKVAGYMTGQGRLDVMCQNPANAIIHLGHPGGTVSLWSPNVKEPLARLLCQRGGVRAVSVSSDGQYMATAGVDRTLGLWDLRMLKQLRGHRVSGPGAGQLGFSQTGLLAAGLGNTVQIYRSPSHQDAAVYLTHSLPGTARSLQFCPFEDVLGVGHQAGFTSLLVPGSGEANFDALEANPYQSKKQRQHGEVKMLLEKIQPEMISLDTSALAKIDRQDLQDAMDEKTKKLFLKPEKFDFAPKHKKKGRSKAGRLERRKKGVVDDQKRTQIRDHRRERRLEAMAGAPGGRGDTAPEGRGGAPQGPYHALGRFTNKRAVSHTGAHGEGDSD